MARSGMISLSSGGSTSKTKSFLRNMTNRPYRYSGLEAIAQRGVEALRNATPVETGLTAASWGYIIEQKNDMVFISWTNTNSINGTHVAILLQFGHGTGTGGYVAGRDYIMPAIQPIFDEIANEVWKKVTSA